MTSGLMHFVSYKENNESTYRNSSRVLSSGCMISVCKIHYECISSGLSSLPTAKTFCNSSPAVRSGGREVEGGAEGGADFT